MKKHGFTLAEVLVTLGIIGVVSALVIPTFTAQTQNAKIGPRVGKAVASFEQATKAMLASNDVDNVSSIGSCMNATKPKPEGFIDTLANNLKGTKLSSFTPAAASNTTYFIANGKGEAYITPDGVLYHLDNTISNTAVETSSAPHLNRYFTRLLIDINGDAGPNADARDRFYFAIMDDGSLRPWGGRWDTGHVWNTNGTCAADTKPSLGNARYCAGNIVENGMRVTYK